MDVVAQMIEFLPRIHKVLDLITSNMEHVLLGFGRWKIIRSSRPSSTTKGVKGQPRLASRTRGKGHQWERMTSETLYLHPDFKKPDEMSNLRTNSTFDSG